MSETKIIQDESSQAFESNSHLDAALLPVKKNNDLLDVIKFILSFMIVAIHTSLFPAVLYPWLRLAVPMFFLISSFLFFKKVNSCEKATEKNKALKSFVIRNVVLYAFWFIAQFPYYFVARGWFDYGFVNGIINILINMIFGSTFIASWFIAAIIIGTVIVFFASKKLSNKALLAIGVVLYIIISLRSSYVILFKNITPIINIIKAYETYLPSPFNSFPVGIFWIVCGKIFADGGFKFKKESTYFNLGVSLALLLGEWLVVRHLTGDMNKDCYLMLAPCLISIFCIILRQKPREFKNALTMRKLSVITFTTHGALIGITQKLFSLIASITLPSVAVFVIVCLICFCMGLVILFLEKYKLFKWLKYSH